MSTTHAPLAFPHRDASPPGDDADLLNWARNATLGAAGAVHRVDDETALREFLAGTGGRVRVLGSRMSPGRMLEVDPRGGTLLDVSRLAGLVASTADTATFAGGTSLQEVYDVLSREGRMLPSSPGVIAEQSLGGALATGTHGQGLGQASIADAVVAFRVVTADGALLEVDRSHPWFPAVQLGLGSLGVTTEVTLETRPSPVYTCRKSATSAADLGEDLLRWNRENDLVKAWWFPEEDQVQVWAARPAEADEVERYRAGGSQLLEHTSSSDSMNATIDRHLRHLRDDTRIVDADGKPYRTVTRFRDFTDVTGDVYQVFCRGIATPQINVEIGIPFDRVPEVVDTLKRWHAETRPRMHYPIILRATGASSAWLSPSQGETLYFGFVVYYSEDGTLSAEGESFLHAVEEVLAAQGGRPHWGKYFDPALYDWRALYPQWDRFREVRDTLDPHHRFANTFTGALFDGGAAA